MTTRPFIVFSLLLTSLLVAGCGQPSEAAKPLPSVPPEAVAVQFYEHISEAGIRGGTIPIKEAYKMVSPGTGMSQQRFIGVVKQYPAGFKVSVVKTSVLEKERRAVVTVEYRMASMFGEGYLVSTDLRLVVDEENLAWMVNFTGETDDQDVTALKKEEIVAK